MERRPLWLACAAAGLALTAAACGGGGGSSSPTSPSGGGGGGSTSNGPIAATVTITSAGVSPKSVTIPVGSRVNFVNNDSRSHDVASDPHPVHTDCPAINLVGLLTVGQSRATADMSPARSCGYHDHDDPTNPAWQGTIVIQ
jgi:plastocyanin